jgi:hypothetical protein
MVARKQKPAPKRKSRSKPQQRAITAITFSGAFRIVREGGGHTLEIYSNAQEAISAGVPEKIATGLFSDVRVAWCWAKIDKEFKLVSCQNEIAGRRNVPG